VGAPVLRHMIQLDGLRALAVLAVLLSHFGASSNQIVRCLPWGSMGVRLFFVLSGFLITGILLKCRQEKVTGNLSGGQELGKFYARRFLRIFPLYYAVLFTVALLNIRPVREYFWWHLTYTSNFCYAWQGNFAGPGSHFWSLAVEEQFYLIWPWVILFTPQRCLLPLNVALIALAVVFRSLGAALGWNGLALQILPIGCFDALGMGSLLAMMTSGGRVWTTQTERFAIYSFWSGLVILAILGGANATAWVQKLGDALQVGGMALVFMALVAWGARGMGGGAGKFLSWRPLIYIGKISYGIYVYHPFMSVVGPRVFGFLGINGFYQRFDAILNTAMTIILASASWHFFESPINRLKERFRYEGERLKPAASALSPACSGVSKSI
jgi:peptidoglycan/LPS O-acetylase OafA/YrhL